MTQETITEDPVEILANALLYEGFMLYPYRRSSLKNEQRWNFGVLFPPSYCIANPTELSSMQTECLIEGDEHTMLTTKVRFLQHEDQRTVERSVSTSEIGLGELEGRKQLTDILFPPVEARMEIVSAKTVDQTYKLTVTVKNTLAEATNGKIEGRDQALTQSLISAHIILSLRNGNFYSLMDPPEQLLTESERCQNIGTWPVLVGKTGQRDRMLSAPIILYDYPSVAPQSHGDLFDNTEIDEILTLRLLTLTTTEKEEALRGGEEQVQRLLERTDKLRPSDLLKLHGNLQRDGDESGTRFTPGDRVRLQPKRRADIFDIVLKGRTGLVTSIERDLENNEYVCVTIDDDPGRDLGQQARPGHRFFFGFDEVEKLS